MKKKNCLLLLIFYLIILGGCQLEEMEGLMGKEPVNIYPVPGSKNVFPEGELMIVFDNVPSLMEGKYIEIYEAGNSAPVDRIRIFNKRKDFNNTTAEDKGTVQLFPNSGVKAPADDRPQDKPGFRGVNMAFIRTWLTEKDNRTLNLDPEKSTALYITPEHGAIQYGKTYRVEIPADAILNGYFDGKEFSGFEEGDWTFTTRSAPTGISASKPITVNGSQSPRNKANFRTVWAALNWIRTAPKGNYTINVAPGVYNELINYHVDAANASNITINGTGTEKYGADVVIQWINCNNINGGSGSTHWRSAVYFSGPKKIILKNLTIKNLDEHSGNQAEALMFGNAKGADGDVRIAYNCGFYGHQDTIQTSGRCWFYKCYIEGDTDFICGSSDVALFEECEIVSIACKQGFVFVARLDDKQKTVSKGYVALNSSLVSKAPGNLFGRTLPSSSGSFDQAAVINCTISGNSPANGYASSLWKVSHNSFLDNGEHVGFKVYNLRKPDGSEYPAGGKDAKTSLMTDDLYNAEYSNRNVILNRVYNSATGLYQDAAFIWDVSGYIKEFISKPAAYTDRLQYICRKW